MEESLLQRQSRDNRIHCVEINPDRVAVLKSKGFSVVWDDFLTFNPLTPYEVVLMNPPFREGAKHLLKALNLLTDGGQIACILNAETIRNPFSNERKDLIRRLEEMEIYTVDFIKNAFEDTDVEIALIYTKKKPSDVRCITLEGFEKSIAEDNAQDFQSVRRYGEIDGLIDNYRAEVQTALRLFDEIQAFNRISIGDKNKSATMETIFDVKNLCGGRSDIVRKINKVYWTRLLYSKELARLLTTNVQCAYASKLNEMAEFEFNERNILQLKADLARDLLTNIDQAVMKVWDNFTRRFA